MPWEPVNDDEPLQEGDQVRTTHCIMTANLPFSDVQARLAIEASKLTGGLNDELPECMEAEVLSTELNESSGFVVNGQECDYEYVTTYEITSLEGDCPDARAGVLGQALILALAAFITFGSMAILFHEAEKFTQAPGGGESVQNVSTGLLLVAAGWAFTQFAGTDQAKQAKRRVSQRLGEPPDKDPEDDDASGS